MMLFFVGFAIAAIVGGALVLEWISVSVLVPVLGLIVLLLLLSIVNPVVRLISLLMLKLKLKLKRGQVAGFHPFRSSVEGDHSKTRARYTDSLIYYIQISVGWFAVLFLTIWVPVTLFGFGHVRDWDAVGPLVQDYVEHPSLYSPWVWIWAYGVLLSYFFQTLRYPDLETLISDSLPSFKNSWLTEGAKLLFVMPGMFFLCSLTALLALSLRFLVDAGAYPDWGMSEKWVAVACGGLLLGWISSKRFLVLLQRCHPARWSVSLYHFYGIIFLMGVVGIHAVFSGLATGLFGFPQTPVPYRYIRESSVLDLRAVVASVGWVFGPMLCAWFFRPGWQYSVQSKAWVSFFAFFSAVVLFIFVGSQMRVMLYWGWLHPRTNALIMVLLLGWGLLSLGRTSRLVPLMLGGLGQQMAMNRQVLSLQNRHLLKQAFRGYPFQALFVSGLFLALWLENIYLYQYFFYFLDLINVFLFLGLVTAYVKMNKTVIVNNRLLLQGRARYGK
jgi:hypothetical protein